LISQSRGLGDVYKRQTWAIRWTKLSINQIIKERVNHLLEASMALEQVTFELADHKEATLAFKEKRKPKFQ
jgi:enoyl-CoA hydratase